MIDRGLGILTLYGNSVTDPGLRAKCVRQRSVWPVHAAQPGEVQTESQGASPIGGHDFSAPGGTARVARQHRSSRPSGPRAGLRGSMQRAAGMSGSIAVSTNEAKRES